MSKCKSFGFSLIELLVVVLIMSIIFSLVGLSVSLGDDDQKSIEKEKDRLMVLIKLAQDEAIMQSREYGLAFWKNGYAFFWLSQEGTWAMLNKDDHLRKRQLPEDVEFDLIIEGIDVKLELEEKYEQPQIYILSSGEVTPFIASISMDGEFEQELEVDALGNLVSDEDEDDEDDER